MNADRAPNAGASPSGRSILIVEDHEDAREALRALLELDIALVDIGLPEVDGYEVARRMRALGLPCPYLIALTGYGQPDDVKRARDAGFDAHLLKPIDPGALTDVLSAIRPVTP